MKCFILDKYLIMKFHGQLHGCLCPANVDFSSFFVLSSYLLIFPDFFFLFISLDIFVFNFFHNSAHNGIHCIFCFIEAASMYHGYIFSVDVSTAAANQLLTIIIFVIIIFLPDSPEWPYCCQNFKIYRFWYLNLHLCSWIWLHGKSGMSDSFIFFPLQVWRVLALKFPFNLKLKNFIWKHPIYLFLFFMMIFANNMGILI